MLDLLTPSGKFSVAYARCTGYDGFLKSVTIREEQGRMGTGKMLRLPDTLALLSMVSTGVTYGAQNAGRNEFNVANDVHAVQAILDSNVP